MGSDPQVVHLLLLLLYGVVRVRRDRRCRHGRCGRL